MSSGQSSGTVLTWLFAVCLHMNCTCTISVCLLQCVSKTIQ